MATLLLDSSNTSLSVGFESSKKLLGCTSYEAWQVQSEHMVPEIDKLMTNLGLTRKDITGIVVSIGPGSYTGVRIAVVISKMIAAMNNIRLFKFSSLLSIASSNNSESYIVIDCRRGNAYTAHYSYDNGKLVCLEEEKIEKIEDYYKKIDKSLVLTEGKPNPTTIINSPNTTLVEDINALSPNYLQLVEAERIKRGLL